MVPPPLIETPAPVADIPASDVPDGPAQASAAQGVRQ